MPLEKNYGFSSNASKPPIATISILLLVLSSYFVLSSGLPFIPDSSLSDFSFKTSSLDFGLFLHPFVHVGFSHLLTNLVPLAFFLFLCERKIGSVRTAILFLFGAVASALVFSSYSPNVALAGCSSGITALVGCSALLQPKKTFAVLLATALLLLLLSPLSSLLVSSSLSSLNSSFSSSLGSAQSLEEEGRFYEAREEYSRAASLNESISSQLSGMEREEKSRTDLPVHLYGLFFGLLFAWLFYRNESKKAVLEFGGEIDSFLGR